MCFQDVPPELLLAELQDANPLHIWCTVDGLPTREALTPGKQPYANKE
jgi:hypothetical protein